MKKLLIPLSLMALTMLPTGCMTKDNTNADIAKSLSNSITEVMESAKKVADIDENKLAINELNGKTNLNKDYTKDNSTYKNRTIRKLVKNNKNGANNSYQKSTTFTQNNINNGSVYSKYVGNNGAYNKNSVNTATQSNNTQNNNFVSDSGHNTYKYSTAEYNPRFTNTNQNVALTNYMEKIQDLYAICNDTCAASSDLDGLKDELINTCNNCNNLLKKVQNGEVKLTQEQQNTLCEYNKTLQSCIDDLNSCRSCSEDVNIINTLKGNFSNNCDTLVAKYLKVLNNLDINGSYCNNAQCTVAEINNYISGICGESVNNYVSRYRFDSYAVEDNTKKQDSSNSASSSQNNNINNTTNNTQQNNNTSNNAQNSAKNNQYTKPETESQTKQNATNAQNNSQNQVVTNQQKTYQNTPSKQVTPVYTQSNKTTQNSSTQKVVNNKPNANNQNRPTTYPMPRPVNNGVQQNTNTQPKQNVYGGSAPKTTPEYDTPNRHPLTKDIKQNPNKQAVNSQNSKTADEVVTYNNRYNDYFAVSTPSPKSQYSGVSAKNNSTDTNTSYRADSKKVYSRPSFTNHQIMFGPKDVRANNKVMTLEEI